MYLKYCMCVGPVCLVFMLVLHAWLRSPAAVRYIRFSQVTLLPLSCFSSSFPFLSWPHLLPIFLFLPTTSARSASSLLWYSSFPSAFDDLSQAHGGEYNKGGYGGSAQTQAKSAGSGPGKGTHTTRVHTTETQSVDFPRGLWLYSQLERMLLSRVLWRKLCVYACLCLFFDWLKTGWKACISFNRLLPTGWPPFLTEKMNIWCLVFTHQQWGAVFLSL